MFRRSLKRIWPKARRDMEAAVRAAVLSPAARRLLNHIYLALPYDQKVTFYNRYSEIFSGRPDKIAGGIWRASFGGRPVLFPLGNQLWLEWAGALSALGHDPDVKRTYLALFKSAAPPRVVFDVGTNYGLHSVLLLAHGARVVSFEPNPNCHGYFRRLCRLNGLEPDIQPVALGDAEGETELYFPEREEWLGATDPETVKRLKARGDVRSVASPVITLDSFVRESGLKPDLIKLDAEGAELAILRGAGEVLSRVRPLVIFESWPGEGRKALADVLRGAGYRASALPLPDPSSPRLLSDREFLHNPSTNFMASPG